MNDKPRVGGSASGIPARGYSWRKFEAGNDTALRHGAYANGFEFGERARQIADELRPTLPLYYEADEPSLALLSIAMTRVERASRWINEIDTLLGDKGLGGYLSENADRVDRLRKEPLLLPCPRPLPLWGLPHNPTVGGSSPPAVLFLPRAVAGRASNE